MIRGSPSHCANTKAPAQTNMTDARLGGTFTCTLAKMQKHYCTRALQVHLQKCKKHYITRALEVHLQKCKNATSLGYLRANPSEVKGFMHSSSDQYLPSVLGHHGLYIWRATGLYDPHTLASGRHQRPTKSMFARKTHTKTRCGTMQGHWCICRLKKERRCKKSKNATALGVEPG